MRGRKPKAEVKTDKSHNYTKAELELRKKANALHKSVPDGLSCPKILKDPKAQAEWKRLMPLYRKLGVDVLNDLDVKTLMAYCNSVAIYERAMEQHAEEGYAVTVEKFDKYGSVTKVKNPTIKIMDEEGILIARYAEVLLLSPVGRVRMGKVPPSKTKEGPKGSFDDLYKDDEDDEVPPSTVA